jgi:hypothetical protein
MTLAITTTDVRKWAEAIEVDEYENVRVGQLITVKTGKSGIVTKIIVPKYPRYKDIQPYKKPIFYFINALDNITTFDFMDNII